MLFSQLKREGQAPESALGSATLPVPAAEAALTFSLLTVAQGASLTTKPLDGALDSSWEEGFMYTCIASLSTTSASCSHMAQLGCGSGQFLKLV